MILRSQWARVEEATRLVHPTTERVLAERWAARTLRFSAATRRRCDPEEHREFRFHDGLKGIGAQSLAVLRRVALRRLHIVETRRVERTLPKPTHEITAVLADDGRGGGDHIHA